MSFPYLREENERSGANVKEILISDIAGAINSDEEAERTVVAGKEIDGARHGRKQPQNTHGNESGILDGSAEQNQR